MTNSKKKAESLSASQRIDARIHELDDWRGALLAQVRAVIRTASPDVIEEWKWDVPVWSAGGILCTGETYQKAVKLTFPHGASLPDPTGLFNASLEGKVRRAIDFAQGARVPEKALRNLIQAAIEANKAKVANTASHAPDKALSPRTTGKPVTSRAVVSKEDSEVLPADAVHPKTLSEWRTWLQKHHQRETGVWLVTYKKATGKARLEYEEAVEEALCFGWVDSKPGKLDDERGMLYFAPRKAGTGWSKPNKERAARLTASGRMMPAGLTKVEAAKRDGSWSRLDAVEAQEIPADLAQALSALPHAQGYFEAFPRSVKRSILEWIANAKKPETRAKRVTETAELAEKNIRANQWRQ